MKEIQQSFPDGLQERAKLQGQIGLADAKEALQNTVDIVKQALTEQQKEVSRCLVPHLQGELLGTCDPLLLDMDFVSDHAKFSLIP